MELTPQEQTTLETYERIAPKWASTHNGNFWATEIAQFHQLLPSGSVLEVGSGGGRDARELIALGYDYTGTDISPAFLAEASKQNPNGRFLLSSVYELDFPPETFDGFWASAILLHLPKDRLNYALQRIKACVKKGGLGFISVKQGEGSKLLHEQVDGEPCERFFSYYSEPEFTAVLESEGFSVIDFHIKEGRKETWLVYLVRC